MVDRAAHIAAFIAAAGWGDATRAPLAGDASNRRYERLSQGGSTAVLMDAPPDKGEDVRPFVAIARHLSALGLAAPHIMAEDPAQGLLLIEDLGDALFARHLDTRPEDEGALYAAATDVLVALHAAPLPDAPDYGPQTMIETAELAPFWYAGGIDPAAQSAALAAAFDTLAPWSPVLVLRDYHAENLLWLPDRAAPANVGLLDFQDAGHGHPAYDLMSLARDARRDVSPATAQSVIARYCDRTGTARAGFEQAAATVSAQRNLRILGVFARLCLRDEKPGYIDLIPRVWGNLMADLAHPALADLRAVVLKTLPPPDPSHLSALKAKCATLPTA